jgi:pimeloyl-ACP methyl ester carboxylesterase
MEGQDRPRVLLLPGGVMPVSVSYAPLVELVRDDADFLMKDLEVYADDAPPTNYGLGMEIDAVKRVADGAGWQNFHLVGYSGGGAVSVAFAARYPERLLSLALIEPAWAGNKEWTPDEVAHWVEMDRVMQLPETERLPAFIRNELRPGVEFAFPPGPQPPWMAKRPAGLAALVRAFKAYDLNLDRLTAFQQPAYIAICALSTVVEEHKAERLARHLPNLRVEVYQGLHHFNPPQRAAPQKLAAALRTVWKLGDALSQE